MVRSRKNADAEPLKLSVGPIDPSKRSIDPPALQPTEGLDPDLVPSLLGSSMLALAPSRAHSTSPRSPLPIPEENSRSYLMTVRVEFAGVASKIPIPSASINVNTE